MRVAVTGAHGLIGSALVDALRTAGHDVVRLVRSTPAGPDEVQWDPTGGTVDLTGLAGVEAAVHLAGAGVGDHRWSAEYKRVVHDSRVLGTRTLVKALTSLDPLPTVLVSGSAIGYYGDRGDQVLTEDSGPGEGFLVDVVKAWESAADPARDAGIRVVHPRTGLVMARSGGAFSQLLPLARLGLGGPLGNGRQWWSWITLTDAVAALIAMIESDLAGPVNLTAPNPAHNADVIRAIARAVHRPAVLPTPAFALRIALGEFAGEILASQRVTPGKLTDAGFGFKHETLTAAAAWITTR
jgi:uncharacterized protein (TIGR01777 family)